MSSPAPAVSYGVKVIEALAESPTSIGISEISRRTEINKNMVSRILHTLEEENWVRVDEKDGYSLTLLPFCLASKAVNRTTLMNVAVPLLEKLWKQSGESTYLGILHNEEVLYLVHLDSVQPIRVAGTVGGSYPLYCTAPGKVLLAYSSEAYLQDYLKEHPLERYTQNTITDFPALRQELECIREKKYAFDKEEYGRGIVCMAAPVFNHAKEVIGAIGCSLSTVYCKPDDIYAYCGESLLKTAKQISICMGYVDENRP